MANISGRRGQFSVTSIEVERLEISLFRIYGVEILTDDDFVLSQYTHIQTDEQNCDSNAVRCITCSRKVKSD